MVERMSILTGPMRKHVNGHKELTNHSEIVKIQASNLVSIPLINGTSTTVEVYVKEGDKVKVGTKIAARKDNMYVPLFSSVSGVVGAKQTIMHASLKPVEHLVIENDGKYTREQSFNPMDYQTSTREELIEFMMNAGIVGCGGAGFPTYIKYKFAKDVESIVINGVECEPYITADYKMMEAYISDLILGTQAMIKMAMAKDAIIAIKNTKKELIAQVNAALTGIGNIRVAEVPDVYPMGWERTLVFQLTKKHYDKLPGEVGLIVNNATTAIAFAQALSKGEAITEKVVTVSGNGIKSPSNVQVPVGVKASEVIAACGGYAAEDVLLIAGGPMMGKTITSDQFVITPYSNALTVFINKEVNTIACLRCGKCSDHCPAALQPVRINGAEQAKDIDSLIKLHTSECIECGMCTYICPSKIDVTEGIRRAKRYMALQKR